MHAMGLDERGGRLDRLEERGVRHGGRRPVRRRGNGSTAVTGAGPAEPLNHGHEAERLEHALVEAVLPLQERSIRRRNAPDSAPWITRWS